MWTCIHDYRRVQYTLRAGSEEIDDRFRDRNMYGERGENVYQVQELPPPSRQAT